MPVKGPGFSDRAVNQLQHGCSVLPVGVEPTLTTR